MYIIYHNRDFDGFCSGAICLKRYPDAIAIGYDYGMPIPYDKIKKGQPVIMVDVSLPMDDMATMALYTDKQFTWIDHHQSSILDYEKFTKDNPLLAGYITPVLIQVISACEITWNYLFDKNSMPIAVNLLGQYDTFRNENKANWNMLVLPFQYGLKCWSINSAESFPTQLLGDDKELIKSTVDNIISEGHIVLSYQNNIDAVNMQSSFEIEFEGFKAIACNGAGLGSMAFESVWDESKYDIMMPFKFNGNNWSFSIYTTKQNIDCSLLAKKYNGGGHKMASGFITNELPDFLIK